MELQRDNTSNALINTNDKEYQSYMEKRQLKKANIILESRVSKLEAEIEKIKEIIKNDPSSIKH